MNFYLFIYIYVYLLIYLFIYFSMLSLATKTHTSFGITLMRHILRCRCHKDAGISNRQYFCGVRRTDISANNRHTDGY